MAILGILIGVLALVATVWGVFYSGGQLREAKAIREQNERNATAQMKEDNLWAEKYIKAGNLMCRIADTDRFGFISPARVVYMNGALSALFNDDVRRQILGQLIDQQDDRYFALRPIDIFQLRLKATRDLIDLVLATVDRFRKEKSGETKELGL